jgi:hypothetical protein
VPDAQVSNEHLLASGEVPALFVDDDVENIIAGVCNEAGKRVEPLKYLLGLKCLHDFLFP